MKTDNYFSIITKGTKDKPPAIPWRRIKDAVLGKRYSLSLVFANDRHLRLLNKTFRGRDKTTNILSFGLSPTEGEVFINQKRANLDRRLFKATKKSFLTNLFIHGLLHLKGYRHGSTMERIEQIFCKKFGVR